MKGRKQPIYGNCKILSPDGILLCRTQRKRTDWYTDRNLASVVSENPHTIRLNFEPKGKGHAEQSFYLAEKENQCVCCGSKNNLTLHHCVPHCFRKWFDDRFKRRDSHDVLILCPICHHIYEKHALKLKHKLFFEATGHSLEQQIFQGASQRQAIRAAKAIQRHSGTIPTIRLEQLHDVLRKFLGKSNITKQDVDLLCNMNGTTCQDTVQLGKIVVGNLNNLHDFIRLWRTHFMETMNPKFMPAYWSIDHNLVKL
jgi:hypothetical protein